MNMRDTCSISGTKTTDHCALVIFQDSTNEGNRKPSIPKGQKLWSIDRNFAMSKITPWFKTKDRPRLPDNMQLSSKVDDNELVRQDSNL